MIGFLNIRQAAEFLGGRSISWMRKNLVGPDAIPGVKLNDRWLFRPEELSGWVERQGERNASIDLDQILDETIPRRRGRPLKAVERRGAG